MQRKNNFLKTSRKRDAFAMIMAMGVVVILGTIMALSLSLNTLTTKYTNDLYLYEQSAILAKSASEYALLQIAQNNTNANPCNETNINFTQDSFYDINITLKYVYTMSCSDSYTTITTPEQNGSVLIDIAVSVTDESITTKPIRYFRRTIQKL